MKFAILIAFVIALATHQNAAEAASLNQSAKYVADCRSQFKLTDDTKHYNLTTGSIADADVNEDMKCYLNCFMEKLDLIKDNKLQEEDGAAQGFKEYLGEETSKALIETCRSETGTGKCETAFKLHRCFLKNISYVIVQVFAQ